MLQNRRAFLLTALSLPLAGCAATGAAWSPATPSAPGMGLIYVYRPLGEFIGRGEDPYVQIGSNLPKRLRAGGFVMFEAPEGIVSVRAFQNMLFLPTIPHIIDVEVASTGPSYIRLDQRVTKASVGGSGVRALQTVEITEVDESEALPEISRTRG